MIISFEGLDGSGKTTQIVLLEIFLRSCGINYLTFKDPGSSILGKHVKNFIAEHGGSIDPMSEMLLFLSARRELVMNHIAPAIQNNQTVIIDRFLDSTIAYQGYGRGLNIELIEQLHANWIKIKPDITFVLSINPKQALNRVSEAAAFEKLCIDFHYKVYSGYLNIAQKNSRCVLIDASLPIQSISNLVQQTIQKRCNLEPL